MLTNVVELLMVEVRSTTDSSSSLSSPVKSTTSASADLSSASPGPSVGPITSSVLTRPIIGTSSSATPAPSTTVPPIIRSPSTFSSSTLSASVGKSVLSSDSTGSSNNTASASAALGEDTDKGLLVRTSERPTLCKEEGAVTLCIP